MVVAGVAALAALVVVSSAASPASATSSCRSLHVPALLLSEAALRPGLSRSFEVMLGCLAGNGSPQDLFRMRACEDIWLET